MQDRHEVVLTANIADFKRKMKEAQNTADTMGKRLQQSLKMNKGIFEDNEITRRVVEMDNNVSKLSVNFGKLSDNMKLTKTSVLGVSNNLGKVSEESKKVEVNTQGISKAFDKGLKSVKKLTLGFLGARSAFMLFRKYMGEYQSQNEEFANKMQLTTNVLVNSLAPAFEFFGNVIQYAVIGLARIIELLTGVNILVRTVDNGFKGASKSAKEFNDNLSGLDEISNIQEDSGGLSTGIGSQLNALNEFQNKIAEVDEWLKKTKIKDFFEGLRDVIGSLRTAIGKAWEKLKESFATGDFSWVGNGLKSGFELAVDLIKSIDWAGLGTYIGGAITNFVLKTDWIGLGKSILKLVIEGVTTLSQIHYSLIDGAIDAVKNYLLSKIGIDSESIGGKLASGIATGFKNGLKLFTGSLFNSPIANVKNAFDWVTGLFRAKGGIFAGSSWQPITAYASGGGPTTGEMFVAREAGPEMVGTIGGHTAVMNNDQIVASVSAGVYEAVLSAMGGQSDRPIVLNINGKELAKVTYGDFQEESSRRGTNTSIRRV